MFCIDMSDHTELPTSNVSCYNSDFIFSILSILIKNAFAFYTYMFKHAFDLLLFSKYNVNIQWTVYDFAIFKSFTTFVH